jgi:copper transport protein
MRLPVRIGVRARVAIAAFMIALLAAPPVAGAHAFLIASTPTWGAVVQNAPHELRLVFSEAVVPRYARVAVAAAHGEDLAGDPSVAGAVVSVPVRGGTGGSYTVRWRMVAGNDGHATQGVYSFGVRAKPLPPAPVRGLDVPIAPQVLAWVEFVAVVLAGGMLCFRALVLAPSRRMLAAPGARDAPVAIRLAVVGAVVGLHAGVLGFLIGAYPIVGGGISGLVNTEIEPIRVGTHLGQAWTLMTFAWLGVLILLIAAWVTPRRREPLLGGAGVLTLGIAFGISWASHPASRGTPALIADYVHLVAGALWVGGAIAIAVTAARTRALPRPAREALARESVLRFSKLALPAVAVVGVAGVYLALRELPAPSALLSTGYGITLLVKSLVVVGALALGAFHRRFVVPRIANGAPVSSISNTLAVEVGLLLVVLALAATLSQTTPPG